MAPTLYLALLILSIWDLLSQAVVHQNVGFPITCPMILVVPSVDVVVHLGKTRGKDRRTERWITGSIEGGIKNTAGNGADDSAKGRGATGVVRRLRA